LTETLAQVYGDERWGRAYLYKDAIYATGYHRGQDIRKQNANKTASVSHNVLALNAGEVVYVGRKTKIGLTIVIETNRAIGTGRFESHSHLRNAQVKVGDTVKIGTYLADTDTNRSTAGTSWGGPHDHITFTDHLSGAWNTAYKTYDPRPIIKAARAYTPPKPPAPKPSTGGNKGDVPVVPEPLKKKETKMLICYIPKDPKTAGRNNYFIIGESGVVMRFTGDTAAKQFESQIGGQMAVVSQAFINELNKAHPGTVQVEVVNLD